MATVVFKKPPIPIRVKVGDQTVKWKPKYNSEVVIAPKALIAKVKGVNKEGYYVLEVIVPAKHLSFWKE